MFSVPKFLQASTLRSRCLGSTNQIPGSPLVSSKHVLLWTAGDHNHWSDTGIWCGPGDWNAADDGGMDGKGKEGVHGEVCLDHVWPKWHWCNKINMTIILINRIRILIVILKIMIYNSNKHYHHQRDINPDSPEQSKGKLVQPTAEIRGAITKSNDLE